MKSFLKIIVAGLLAVVARGVIRRYRPKIVMITGSVGKTSTKDAIATVLATRYLVRKSHKSFNSEFGVPFTILGVKNPWGNPLAWYSIMASAIGLLLLPNHYPKMLVLEVGADKPGDLKRILRMATPDVVVVTRLPEIPVHVEAYTSPQEVREEEFSPAYALPPGAPLIVSSDDQYALNSSAHLSAHVISYGLAESATVQVSEIEFCEKERKVVGMRAQVKIKEEKGSLSVMGSVGTTQVLPAAAALAVASALDIPFPEAVKALESYQPPPGRGRLLVGVNNSIIIDDTYNASPAAVEEALTTLQNFPHAKRRVAVLGDMLELGRYSAKEHERIGQLASGAADILVAVGIRTRASGATHGSAEVILYDNSRTAAKELPGLIREGDVILVKGSESIRTERIVQALLAHITDISLLVRQEKEWVKKA